MLVSMRYGVGNLVGMSVSMGRGLAKGKAGLLMLEDRTCETDISYSVRMTVANGDATRDVEVVFEGETDISALLGSVLESRDAQESRTEDSRVIVRLASELVRLIR